MEPEAVFDESPAWRMRCAEMFGNRLGKNAPHLRKWAKREGTNAYRLYDQDIPEVPFCVDYYNGALVLGDYRMTSRDGRRRGGDQLRSELASAASSRLGIAPNDIFVKSRERLAHTGTDEQYQRHSELGHTRVVTEYGANFIVNLSDYLDTGLFLDHRTTRKVATAERFATRQVRMLNLFCYTGAFSVHAARAGMTTTSVDLSKTYLEWAKANFRENQLGVDQHEFVHSDVKRFLRDAASRHLRFDLIVVDPPTFSNSKRMDYTWDIARDHPALLADVAAVTAPGGVIWFSTNSRRFKLQIGGMRQFAAATITDETAATIPTDFRDNKVHHSYRIKLPG